MSLENKSKELKKIVEKFETKWFLGHISGLIMNIVSGLAESEIKNPTGARLQRVPIFI